MRITHLVPSRLTFIWAELEVTRSSPIKGTSLLITPYRIKRFDALIFAIICWLIVTGLTIEHVLVEGVTSWTLLIAMPILTLLIGVLLHEFTSNWWRVRGWIALPLAIGGFMITLPSSIETLGNAKETSINLKSEYNSDKIRLKDELLSIGARLNTKIPEYLSECKGAPVPLPTDPTKWPRCRSLTGEVTALENQRMVITKSIEESKPLKPILAGERNISWFLGLFKLNVTASDQVKFGPIFMPIVLEFLVAYFLWLGLESHSIEPKKQTKKEQKSRPEILEPVDPTSPKEFPLVHRITSKAHRASGGRLSIDKVDIRQALIEALREPAESNNELAERMEVSAAEASRRVSLAEDIVLRERRGKYVLLKLKDIVEHEPG